MTSNSQKLVCSILSLAGAASLVAFANPAHAATTDANDLRRTIVRYDDLDLAKPAGRAVFDSRVSQAADTVCKETDRTRMAAQSQCRRTAVAEAHRAVGLDARG